MAEPTVAQPVNNDNVEYGSQFEGVTIGNSYGTSYFSGQRGRIQPALEWYTFSVTSMTRQNYVVTGTAVPAAGTYFTINSSTGSFPLASPITGVDNNKNGANVYTLNVPSSFTVTPSGTATGSASITFYGYDYGGFSMADTLTLPTNGGAVNSTKSFAYLYGIYVTTNNSYSATIGITTSARFGLPTVLTRLADVIACTYNGAAIVATTSFIPADFTNPITSTTGDTRGIVVLPTLASGAQFSILYVNEGCTQTAASGIALSSATTGTVVNIGPSVMTYGNNLLSGHQPVNFP